MRRSPRSLVWSTAVAAALALGLAACGGSSSGKSGTGSTGSSSKNINTQPGNDINPQPREKIADGGTLRWPEAGISDQLNYNEVDGTDGSVSDIMAAVLEEPFYADAKGIPRNNTNLVASYTVTQSPQQVVTLEINPKAVWQDGTPVSEADFEAQWKALNGTNQAFQVSTTVGYSLIQSIKPGKSDKEVVITFSKPYSEWQGLFSPMYPAATNSDPKKFVADFKDAIPTSDGPFKLGSIDQTAKTLTLVRNDKWWGDPPKLDKIIFMSIDLDAQTDALANNEVDLQYGIGSHVSYYARVKNLPNVTVHKAAGPVWANLTFNGASGSPLSDVLVRNALTIGINRKQIDTALVGPLGVSTDPLNNHVLLTNQQGYQDNSGDLGKQDAARAKQLLDQAGWTSTDGGKTRTKNGKPLNLRFVINATSDSNKQLAEIVQNQLAAIGVQITIVPVPGDDYYTKYVNVGDFDIAQVVFGGNAYPLSTAQPEFANPTTGSDGTLNIQQNYGRIGDPAIDTLFTEALSSLDRTKAESYANQADAAIWKLDTVVPLFQRPQIVATNTKLANYGAPGVQDTIYENLGFVSGS
ncbi:ABC transporter family substrate-binding protein [Catenulispora acidiphila]|uniref:ABC transporter family substrate-binding protein n=1 Tax=Catenulispora acidiphila TaxID=304895 RepID=UPI001CBBB2A0|nr:ABC transporter family substrate-binding protein [Catenulispora acidiphila]